MISILLIQDLLAMFALLIIPMLGGDIGLVAFARPFVALPMVMLISYMIESVILSRLFNWFEKIESTCFCLLSLGA